MFNTYWAEKVGYASIEEWIMYLVNNSLYNCQLLLEDRKNLLIFVFVNFLKDMTSAEKQVLHDLMCVN